MTGVSNVAVSEMSAAEAHLPRDPVARLAALFDDGTMSPLTATAI